MDNVHLMISPLTWNKLKENQITHGLGNKLPIPILTLLFVQFLPVQCL